MKLWSQFFIVWVQSSLLIGHAGCKVFTDLSLVCFVGLCSVHSGQQICNFREDKVQEKEKRMPLQVFIFLRPHCLAGAQTISNHAFKVFQSGKAVRKHYSQVSGKYCSERSRGLWRFCAYFVHYLNFFILILPLSLRDRPIKAQCPLAPAGTTRKWELLVLSSQNKAEKETDAGLTLAYNVMSELSLQE